MNWYLPEKKIKMMNKRKMMLKFILVIREMKTIVKEQNSTE